MISTSTDKNVALTHAELMREMQRILNYLFDEPKKKEVGEK